MHGNIILGKYRNIVTIKKSAISRTKKKILYKYFPAVGLACVILQGKRSRVIDGWLHPALSLDTVLY